MQLDKRPTYCLTQAHIAQKLLLGGGSVLPFSCSLPALVASLLPAFGYIYTKVGMRVNLRQGEHEAKGSDVA